MSPTLLEREEEEEQEEEDLALEALA